MKKIVLFLCITIFQSSCAEKEISIPDDVMKQKEMTAILTDVHIAQASLTSRIPIDSSSFSMNDYLNTILKNHKTKREDFLRSLKFYSDNPEILEQVYDSVITGLSRMEASAEK